MSSCPLENALIGHTGFVGSTLVKQFDFGQMYRSSNIHEIEGRAFDRVVCAGASAQKWIANRDPVDDKRRIDALMAHLKKIQCQTFVLISTVDVFKTPQGVDEATPVDEQDLHPYGLHRRALEKFVQQHFSHSLIIRLPGLVGPGLRKNVIFDLHNSNNLQAIESRGVFQFYPMVNLGSDIELALQAGLRLLHLTAAPISVGDLSRQGFGRPFTQTLSNPPACYDMQTTHAEVFGAAGPYQYSARESLLAIRAYAQSEPLARTPGPGVAS